MRMHVMVVMALLGAGCGKHSSKEKAACRHAADLCDEKDGVDECLDELGEAKESMGDHYDAFLDCAVEAKSCGEYVGCAVGGLGAEGVKQIDGVGRGMGKMMGHVETEHGGKTTLAMCKRAYDVCGDDDADRAAEQCATEAGNFKADPANLAKMKGCLDDAKNCYAFRDCATQMFFDAK